MSAMLTQANAGFTTPDKAAQTVRMLCTALVSHLRAHRDECERLAPLIEGGDFESQFSLDDMNSSGICPYIFRSQKLPDLSYIHHIIQYYREAARANSAHVERIPLDIVEAAKKYLGSGEPTIIVGMQATWRRPLQPGGQPLTYEGKIIGIEGDEVAMGSVTVYRGAAGQSISGIHVMPLGEVNPCLPDIS